MPGSFFNNSSTTAVGRALKSSALNSTLVLAKENGMQLVFVSRELYKQKSEQAYLQALQVEYPDAYIIPEGGDNVLGQKGCEEILSNSTSEYDLIFCAHGTGTTFRGIAKSLLPHQKVIAVNVLKYEAACDFLNASINNDYHFGGYAKHKKGLLEFKTWFETTYHISLDYVYTAKLMYAVFDLMKQHKLSKDKKTLIVHSGGLQGNKGYEERYGLY